MTGLVTGLLTSLVGAVVVRGASACGSLVLCLGAGLAAQQVVDPQISVFVERTMPERVFVREPFQVVVRIGIEKAFSELNLVPLIQRSLDLPVQVRTGTVEGAVPFVGRLLQDVPADDGGRTVSAVCDDLVARLRVVPEETRAGRTFLVFETTVNLLPETAGQVVLGAPAVRLAFASVFDEDFVNGRVPRDRQEVVIPGTAGSIPVLPYPEPVPAGFGGAVGQFQLSVSVSPTEVELGQGVSVRLTLAGRGELFGFPAPRFVERPGFELRGTLVGAQAAERIVTYDLLPMRLDVAVVPAFHLVVLDPVRGSYQTVATDPVPISVRAGPGVEVEPVDEGAAAPVWLPWPGGGELAALRVRRTPGLLLLVPMLATWLLFGVVWSFWRRRERQRRDPLGAKARRAFAVWEGELRGGGAPAECFVRYLAARLCCPEAAVIGPGLAARLEVAGVPEPLVVQTVEVLTRSQRMRFSAGLVEGAPVEGLATLAAQLEQVFVATERRRLP